MLHRSVVRIEATTLRLDWSRPYARPTYGRGTGTGSFIDHDGHILTCAHVVAHAKSLRVSVGNDPDTTYPVSIVSCCPGADLAVLRCDAVVRGDLAVTPLRLGDSDTVRVADDVHVVGYPLSQQLPTTTKGIVGSVIDGRFQLDALINPGNSGGPLLNAKQELVGVVDSIVYHSGGSGTPISRAVPLATFLVMRSVMLSGEQLLVHAPWVGMEYANKSAAAIRTYYAMLATPAETTARAGRAASPPPPPRPDIASRGTAADDTAAIAGTAAGTAAGAVVRYVYRSSPFHRRVLGRTSGVRRKDTISSFQGRPVSRSGTVVVNDRPVSLDDLLRRSHWGDAVSARVTDPRNGVTRAVTVTLGPPAPPLAIRTWYPALEPVPCVTLLGLVVSELTVNHLDQLVTLPWDATRKQRLLPYKLPRRHQRPVLIVTEVLVDSPAHAVGAVRAGDRVGRINDRRVRTVDDLVKQVADAYLSQQGQLLLETRSHDYINFSLNNPRTWPVEQTLLKQNQIDPSYSIFKQMSRYGVHHDG